MSSTQEGRDRAPGREGGEQEAPRRGLPAKILIADDDPDYVLSMRLILERRGYTVVTAGNPQEARSRLETERPDLILLDIMMPTGTEGFHFVWDLRNHPDPALRDTPIVVVSAIHRTTELRLYPAEADQEYAPGEFLPVQGFLDKPVDPGRLVQVVETVLAARSERES